MSDHGEEVAVLERRLLEKDQIILTALVLLEKGDTEGAKKALSRALPAHILVYLMKADGEQ